MDAQLVCADAARLDGDTGRARRLYEEVVAALGGSADPRLAPLVLEARIGLAECKVPEGDLRGALAGWHEAASETLRLASPPARLVARCREVALELGERGFGAEVSSSTAVWPPFSGPGNDQQPTGYSDQARGNWPWDSRSPSDRTSSPPTRRSPWSSLSNVVILR